MKRILCLVLVLISAAAVMGCGVDTKTHQQMIADYEQTIADNQKHIADLENKLAAAGVDEEGFVKVRTIEYEDKSISSYYVVVYECDIFGDGEYKKYIDTRSFNSIEHIPSYSVGDSYRLSGSSDSDGEYLIPLIVVDFKVLYTSVKIIDSFSFHVKYDYYEFFDGTLYVLEKNTIVSGISYKITNFD